MMITFVLTDGQKLEGEDTFNPTSIAKSLADENGWIVFTEVGTGDTISIASRNIFYVIHHK